MDCCKNNQNLGIKNNSVTAGEYTCDRYDLSRKYSLILVQLGELSGRNE